MKKAGLTYIGIIFLCFVLGGCGFNNENAGLTGAVSDWDPAYRTDSPYQFAVGAEHGYYIAMQNYLYYLDENQSTPVILCSNPNCSHDGKECNAYFPQSIPQIQYCNGSIYGFKEELFDGREELTVVSADGETKETLIEVNHRDVNEFLVHRDWVYYVVNDGTTAQLIGYDSKEKKEQILYSLENAGSAIGGLFCWNDFLYFYATTVDEEENSDYFLLRYDWKENEVLKLDIKDEEGIPVNYPTVVWAEEKAVFITGISDDRERRYVYTSDLDGANTKMVMDLPYGGLVMDDTYAYVQYWGEMRIDIYNRDSQRVNTISNWRTGADQGPGLSILESGSDAYAFLFESGIRRKDSPISECAVWVMDKSTIGSENCRFEQMLSSYRGEQ